MTADDDLHGSGFGSTVGSFGSQFTPFASRTFQSTKEMLGQTDDKVCGVDSSTDLASHADDHPCGRPSSRPTTSTSRSVSMP